MENFILSTMQSLIPASSGILYVVLFISSIIENLFPPIPGDTITAFGAFLVGTGRLNYFIVYLVTTTGSVIGFTLLFIVGRYFGKEFFLKKDYKYFSSDKILQAEKWFSKYGYLIILVNRFLPGIRSAIAIAAGLSMFSTTKVVFLSFLSSLVWNLIWIHAGYTLGNNWEVVKEKIQYIMKSYNLVVTIILGVVIISYMTVKWYRKRKSFPS